MTTIDRRGLFQLFERLDDALDRPQTICLIGAAAVLALGHAARQTSDIDIWRPGSTINDRAMARAAGIAGVSVDQGDEFPDPPYLQIIRPGVVQLPSVLDGVWATGESRCVIWTGDRLTVECPPPSVIAAAKLVRAEDRDLDDCMFLIRSTGLSEAAVRRAIDAIPDTGSQEAASENMVLLDVLARRTASRVERRSGEGDDR